MPDAKDLSTEDATYWRAVALQDIADVLAVTKEFGDFTMGLQVAKGTEPPAALRLLAHLVSEPHGAGLDPVEQLVVAKRRAVAALQVLRAPEPRKADEAAKLAAAAWSRVGIPTDMHWVLALRPHETFEVSPYQVRLATDLGPWHEPRNVQDLDPGQQASVRRCGVWAPIHVRIVEEPPGLLVIAGSRRTRMIRVMLREGLEALGTGRDPIRPRPLLAIVPGSEAEADIYLADNLLRRDETPWTIAERFACQLEAGTELRTREIAARSGLSERTVAYHLVLARLPGRLRAEGARGRLGVKFAAWLGSIPDLEVQIKLFEVTLPLSSEAARMEAAKQLLEREGEDLADGRELVLPELVPATRKGAFTVLRSNLAAAAAKAKAPAAKKQIGLVADWCAACDGDAEAAERLPAELRGALPVKAAKGNARRHPSQAKQQREETKKPRFAAWEGFTEYEAKTWCNAGLSRYNAEALREVGINPGLLFAEVRLEPKAPSRGIGELYEVGSIDLARLKELVLETMGPLSLMCPACCMDHEHDCQPDPYPDPETGKPDEVIDFEGRKVHAERRDEILQLRERMQPDVKAAPKKAAKKSRPQCWNVLDTPQGVWEAAGVTDSHAALEFENLEIEAATVAEVIQIGDERASLGAFYVRGALTMGQIRARLQQLPLIPTDKVDPREVVCPVCAAAEGEACDDGGHPHKIRSELAVKARALRPVALGEVA